VTGGESSVCCLSSLSDLSSLSGLEDVYLCGRSECVGWRVLRVCLVVESSIEGVVVLWE